MDEGCGVRIDTTLTLCMEFISCLKAIFNMMMESFGSVFRELSLSEGKGGV